MKTVMALLTALIALGLSACASAPAGTASVAPDSLTNVERYRRAVNLNAERKNVEVHWVNPPTEQDLDEYDED
ncbi:hypothetical protein [Elongatibacter sediminis]|uniref:Lipoprotein n=1 Tax=Elongatibacter sediminis TaxID=3119006 RepID=A0AAW9RC61_9GAMM